MRLVDNLDEFHQIGRRIRERDLPIKEGLARDLPPIYIGECSLHGWHGKTNGVCPACRKVGYLTLHRLVPGTSPRRYEVIEISESLIRFRGGGKEKVRQEARCRMCLRSRGPDTPKEWLLGDKDKWVGTRSLTRHHLVPEHWFKYQLAPLRQLRGSDCNIIPLCRQCHDEVERDEEARRMLRRVLGPDEAQFAIQVAGHHWFVVRYPKV